MKELLEFLVKKIVKNTEAVSITEDATPEQLVLNLKVEPSEAGLVIGKGGRTIKSLRNIIKVIAIKEGKRVDIRLANELVASEPTTETSTE
ncbi:MAG: KH domain-containing protein [candidate division WWE3 bacterium]|nr:KH domain-containing protein [candidate division WWE3 bacterium]